jgi:hypothetical protein
VSVYGGSSSIVRDVTGNLVAYPTATYTVGSDSSESPQVAPLDMTLT